MTVHLFVKLLLAKPATLSLAFITILVAAEAVVQSNRPLGLALVAILVAAEAVVQSNGSLILADASHGA